MWFGSSFSQTKKSLKKSIESFKSFVSAGGYTKLIPTSPAACQFCSTLNPFSCTRGGGDTKFRHSYSELDNFYHEDYTKQYWHANKEDQLVAAKEIIIDNNQATSYSTISTTTTVMKLENDDSDISTNVIAGKNYQEKKKSRTNYYERKSGKEKEVMSGGHDEREERARFVAEKLKELETVDDGGNMEHVLDIEEVIHYYSRLTCPAYLRIVDKFFMEMYSEFSNIPAANSGRVNISRPRMRRSVKV